MQTSINLSKIYHFALLKEEKTSTRFVILELESTIQLHCVRSWGASWSEHDIEKRKRSIHIWFTSWPSIRSLIARQISLFLTLPLILLTVRRACVEPHGQSPLAIPRALSIVQLKLPSAASEESISFVTCPFTDAKLGRWRNIYGSTSSITYSIVSQFELCRIPLLGISVFFPFQYYDTVVIDCLGVSGTVMHMFTILYFLVKNVPIFFTEDLVRCFVMLSVWAFVTGSWGSD